MKKRILALALAGTTAFSVFGAAISANAAWTSTDRYYEVDAYMGYTPVAEKINTTNATTTDATYGIDMNDLTDVKTFYIVDAEDRDPSSDEYSSVADYVKYNKDVKEEYAPETKYVFTRNGADMLEKGYKKVTLVYKESSKKVLIGNDIDTTGTVALTGTYYIKPNAEPDDVYGNFTGDIYYTGELSEGDAKAFEAATASALKLVSFDDKSETGTIVVKDGEYKEGSASGITIIAKDNGYEYNGKVYTSTNTLVTAIKEDYTSATEVTQYSAVKDAKVTTTTISATTYEGLKTVADYSKNIKTDSTSSPKDEATISVVDTTGQVWGKEVTTAGTTEHYKDWTFNSDMTGEVSVSPYTVNTTIVNGELKVEKVETPTIYAYDFLPANYF